MFYTAIEPIGQVSLSTPPMAQNPTHITPAHDHVDDLIEYIVNALAAIDDDGRLAIGAPTLISFEYCF